MKSVQAAEPAADSAAAGAVSAGWADPVVLRLKLTPAAEAVIAIAAPATATAPRARPAMRRDRAFRRLLMHSLRTSARQASSWFCKSARALKLDRKSVV